VIRFAMLGSGSAGNGLVVESGGTRVLLDCGFGVRDTTRRLARLGLVPTDLSGIVVTHEHDDHVGGVMAFADRHDLPVWLTWGTFQALGPAVVTGDAMVVDPPPGRCRFLEGDVPFALGDLEVHAFPVPHDAREPVQYVFSDGDRRLGVLTDIGEPTPHVERMLSGCDALVLECNHDRDLLERGPYPRWLKSRVGGAFGHLANDQAGGLLGRIDRSRLSHVVAAHLSERNNTPDHARAALATVLGCAPDWIAVASQVEGLDWREVR